jgi:hypothetical protein
LQDGQDSFPLSGRELEDSIAFGEAMLNALKVPAKSRVPCAVHRFKLLFRAPFTVSRAPSFT